MIDITMGCSLQAGEMVMMKPLDYKAPVPSGEWLGFRVTEKSNFPVAVVIDERLEEGKIHAVSNGSIKLSIGKQE